MLKGSLVYICSPLSAPTDEEIRRNMEKAKEYMAVVAKNFHCRTVAPHAYLPELLDDNIPAERELALSFGLSLLELSSVMVVCGNVISSGMKGEIEKAKKQEIPIFQLLDMPDGIGIVEFR